MPLHLAKHIRLDKDAIISPNLTKRFEEGDLAQISTEVWNGYEKDKASRRSWSLRMEAAMDLAMQVAEEKSFPWPGASNIIFPLVTIAALQFHARAYPTIIQGSNVVKCRVAAGAAPADIERAERIGKFMSYQVLEEDTAWEEQHDRLLLNYSIVGCAFKKSFFDGKLGHNVSQLVIAKDLVVDYYAPSIEAARRKTQVILLHRNDIWERCAAGLFRDVREFSWMGVSASPSLTEEQANRDKRSGQKVVENDWQTPYRCLEQHTWLDLDGDGYDEPYVVTIEESSRDVLRIVSRVDRVEDIDRSPSGKIICIRGSEYFTKYGFIPSPDGGIYDIGFGVLLGPLNESTNTLINQLVDAGTMANTGGGFLGRGAKIRGGTVSIGPGEWKRVDSTGDDLRKSLYAVPVPQPSEVLFKLLGLLIDYTNRIAGATEMLAGENPGQNTKVGTAEAMVEQGLKIYGAIFKRCWRSTKEEFKKLFILNAIHLPIAKSTFTGLQIAREDFLSDPNRIVPVADPNIVSDKMRVQQAQIIADRSRVVPGYNKDATEMNLLQALRVDSPERFYIGAEKAPIPNPKMMVEQEKTRREQLKLKHEAETFLLEIQEQHDLNNAKISQLEAQATKFLADAKGADATVQINAINSIVGALKEHNGILERRAKIILESVTHESGDKSGAIQHLVGKPGDQGPSGGLPSPAGGPEGTVGDTGASA